MLQLLTVGSNDGCYCTEAGMSLLCIAHFSAMTLYQTQDINTICVTPCVRRVKNVQPIPPATSAVAAAAAAAAAQGKQARMPGLLKRQTLEMAWKNLSYSSSSTSFALRSQRALLSFKSSHPHRVSFTVLGAASSSSSSASHFHISA